jgi:membrane fusion protein, multidrug efflux system
MGAVCSTSPAGRALAAWGVSLIAFWTAATAGCGRPAKPDVVRAPPVAVVVETAERRDIPNVVELSARMEAAAVVEIRPNVEGRLTEMSFREGSLIQKGQLLFRIDPRRYEAAVETAAAAVDRAEADLEMAREQQRLANAQSALRQAEANLLKCNQDVERLRPLAARRAVPQRDLDAAVAAQSTAAAAVEDARATVRTTIVGGRVGLRQAAAGVNAARAALETAKLDQAETEIRAPIAGLAGRAEVSAGNSLGRFETRRLTTVSQVDPMDVVFGLSEALYLHTVNTVEERALERIELILSDGSPYPFRGRFAHLAGGVDEKTGNLPAVARFPNPKALLLPGMTGRVRFVPGNRPGAVLVPERALFDAQGSKAAVYVVAPGNRIEMRCVVTDGSYEGKRIISSGLEGGETVVAAADSKLRQGQTVTPRAAQSAKAGP